MESNLSNDNDSVQSKRGHLPKQLTMLSRSKSKGPNDTELTARSKSIYALKTISQSSLPTINEGLQRRNTIRKETRLSKLDVGPQHLSQSQIDKMKKAPDEI